ncbi:phospholipase A2-like protein Y52B11A.8 [Ditylenchus destructor]|nr:phospholipase A2-like protein Y52B11A.8 [Ditylenchus destructor]
MNVKIQAVLPIPILLQAWLLAALLQTACAFPSNSTAILSSESSGIDPAEIADSSTTPDMVSSPITTPRPDFIPIERWHCGASDFDRHLSHQLSEDSCPHRMYEANLCCLAHDLCYVEDGKTQEECDAAFCFCLQRTLVETAQSNHSRSGCFSVADSFCQIVQIFGSAAHSQAKASKTTTPPPTTTTTVAPETSSAVVPVTTAAPPSKILEFMAENVSVQCYNNELAGCIEDLHTCMIEFGRKQQEIHKLGSPASVNADTLALWPVCSQKFCSCANRQPLLSQIGYQPTKDPSCQNSLELMCHTQEKKGPNSVNVNIHLWSTNVQYSNSPMETISIMLMIVAGLLSIVVIGYSLFMAYKVFIKRRRDGLEIAGAQFVSRARRHTLPLRDTEPAYKVFHDKTSPERPSTLHLNAHQHLLPMNSSKSHLIASENSSSTPSINSTI